MCNFTPFDYRTTFLRRHIASVLALHAADGAWEHVQALDDLAAGVPEIDLPTFTLERFLFGGAGWPTLYQPVPIERRPDEPRAPKGRFTDLVALLAGQRAAPPLPGVVVEGDSGAGKTVALYRAFFSCFRGPQLGADVPLLGYCPVWVHVDSTPSPTTLEQILANAAGPDVIRPAQIRTWLSYSPPLLLLCDLDAVPLNSRGYIIDALLEFCWSQSKSSGRSRCVLACGGTDPAVREWLRGRDRQYFHRYGLHEWKDDAVAGYTRAWNAVQNRSSPTPHTPTRGDATATIPEDRLPGLIHQYLIVPDPPAGQPRTDGWALHRWVEERRQRLHDRRSHGPEPVGPGEKPETPSRLALAGATRLAVRLSHGPACAGLLRIQQVEFVLKYPDLDGAPWALPDVDPPFWGRIGNLYFTNTCSDPKWSNWFVRVVRERSPFLRIAGDELRFVGWLGAYFEGVRATRFWLDPDLPPMDLSGPIRAPVANRDWHPAVLHRWGRDPERHLKAARLLGGVLAAEDLWRLLCGYLASLGLSVAPPPERPRVLPLICELLEGWRPFAQGNAVLHAVLSGLDHLLRCNVREEEVLSALDEYMQGTPFYDEFCRRLGVPLAPGQGSQPSGAR